MKFEEGWYILNLIGFRKMPYSYLDGKGSKKHQYCRDALNNFETIFQDDGMQMYHDSNLKRDPSIPVPGPKECVRCKRTENLERDHVVPLEIGGKDVSSNLQWLCRKCHDFKHAEEKTLDGLASAYGEDRK